MTNQNLTRLMHVTYPPAIFLIALVAWSESRPPFERPGRAPASAGSVTCEKRDERSKPAFAREACEAPVRESWSIVPAATEGDRGGPESHSP